MIFINTFYKYYVSDDTVGIQIYKINFSLKKYYFIPLINAKTFLGIRTPTIWHFA